MRHCSILKIFQVAKMTPSHSRQTSYIRRKWSKMGEKCMKLGEHQSYIACTDACWPLDARSASQLISNSRCRIWAVHPPICEMRHCRILTIADGRIIYYRYLLNLRKFSFLHRFKHFVLENGPMSVNGRRYFIVRILIQILFSKNSEENRQIANFWGISVLAA